MRTRSITQFPSNGGGACPALSETSPCTVSFNLGPNSSFNSPVDLFSQNLLLKVVTTGDCVMNIRASANAKFLYHWNVRVRDSAIVQNTTNDAMQWLGEERVSYPQGNLQSNGAGTNYIRLTRGRFTWIRQDGYVLYEFINRNQNETAFFIETSNNVSVSIA